MRVFEMLDLGSIRSVLAVKQGEADRSGKSASIPFVSLKSYLEPLGISTPDALIAAKNDIDSVGDVIDSITDTGTVILKTQAENPDKPATTAGAPAGPSVDQMAASNAKTLNPKL